MIAILVRLRANKTLTLVGALLNVLVALAAGMLLHTPLVILFGLDPSTWNILIAILVALTAENIMKQIVETSSDDSLFKSIIRLIIKKVKVL